MPVWLVTRACAANLLEKCCVASPLVVEHGKQISHPGHWAGLHQTLRHGWADDRWAEGTNIRTRIYYHYPNTEKLITKVHSITEQWYGLVPGTVFNRSCTRLVRTMAALICDRKQSTSVSQPMI